MRQEFQLPESLLTKIYDLSGTGVNDTKGFVLCYINSKGDPMIISKFENNCVKIPLVEGLRGWVKQFKHSQQ